MDLQFLGATDTVTGSKYLLRTARSKVLVDCGLFQGYKNLRLRNWGALPVPAVDIDAIVLTHAHIDHSGYVPLLVRQGFQGPVFCTPATFDLCRILLTDSGHLLEEEADYLNEHGLSRHKPALPLYTREDAVRSLKLFKPVEFDTAWHASGDLQVRFSRSGHLPGSAFTQVDDGRVSVLFSGDLGRPADPVLQPPVRMRKADYLVVESTYGDRLHEREDVLAELAGVINRTAGRGGVVLIPAFAVGRTQALMHLMHLLRERGAIPPIPIYLNSPMAASATQIYRRHLKELRLGAEDCEAMARDVQVVTTPEESRELNRRHGPMIIIAASGMATGGRVLHHIEAFAPDHRNTLLFSGFQAAGTRGRKLLDGAREVKIHGSWVPINAEVAELPMMSAHADSDELLQWMSGFAKPPKRVFVVHGEPDASEALRERIQRELEWNACVPLQGQEFAL